MEEKNKKLLRSTINEEITGTEKVLKSLKDKTKPVSPDNAIGRLSRMDAIGNKSVNAAALRQAQTKLTKLKYALSHINRPGFGICTECEEEIPFARIIVMPESILCVHCAELAE